jgi:acyl carrier protein
MEFDSIAQTVTGVVAEIAELGEDEIWQKRDADLFEELGLDSLLALEIVASLERKYRIQVPEERIVEVRTLAEAIRLVRDTLGPEAEAVGQ